MKSVVVICFILSLVAGRSTASFGDCYSNCFNECVKTIPPVLFHACTLKCFSCITNPSSTMDLDHVDTNHFCKLGCATSLCTKFSTKEDPAEEKVEGCVNACGQTCTKA